MITPENLIHDPIGSYPTATVACFDPTAGDLPRRQIDIQRTQAFLQRLALAGAPAVLIAASTGHGHLRTVEELEVWFRAAAAANLGNCVKMALLRPEDGAAANKRLTALLAELGYPVVFVRPGTNLSPSASDAAVVANMQPVVELIAQQGLAVGVYSIPDVSGVQLTADATAQLLAGPGGDAIVAAKITEANYEASTARYFAHPALSRLKIVQGWDPFLAQALQAGGERAGVTSGPMSFAIYQYLHLFAAVERGDWEEVRATQDAVTALFAAMQDDPTKFADLQRAKYVMGLGQPLLGAIHTPQVERLLEALAELPRREDRSRLARSLDLMGDGPFHAELDALT